MEKSSPSPSKSCDPRRLHIVAFAEEGAKLQGTLSLSELARLAGESPQSDAATPVHWQVQGRTRPAADQKGREIWLALQANVTLVLECQRCLKPIQQAVTVERNFRFVQDEATAARLDEEIEEDVLVCSRQFDLLALVEDELIMALPFAPRHAGCEAAAAMQDAAGDAQPHPFAALQQLKKNMPPQ